MVKIKRAKLDDVDAMVTFGEGFWTQTMYYKQGVEYDYPAITALTTNLIETGGIVQVAYDDDRVVGIILMVKGPMPFNPGALVATELVYYVDPEYRNTGVGTQLLQQAENIAKQQEIKFITMIHLDSVQPEKAESVYNSMGYHRNETAFTKDLG